jgi:hypothetical protein
MKLKLLVDHRFIAPEHEFDVEEVRHSNVPPNLHVLVDSPDVERFNKQIAVPRVSLDIDGVVYELISTAKYAEKTDAIVLFLRQGYR